MRVVTLVVVMLATFLLSGTPGSHAARTSGAPRGALVCTLAPGHQRLPASARHGLIGHLRQYPDPALATSAQRLAAGRLLTRLRGAAQRWRTLAAARRDGYLTRTAPRLAGDARAHYLHAEYPHQRGGAATLDPTRPKSLIYANEPGRPLTLVGVMFAMRRGQVGRTPGGPITRWHAHKVCMVGGRRGRKPLPDGKCPAGTTLRQGSEMMHVWFTRDLRSAFAVSAPEVELCRDGLLLRGGATCRAPRTGRGM